MREGTLDIIALQNSIKRLSEVIIRYQKEQDDDAVRDAVIQRFELTYSILLKTLRKYFIDRAFVIEDVNQMSFNDMVRTACQLNLLKSNLEKWTQFREMRNLTSHTYDEEIALKVVAIVPEFYQEALYLVEKLKNNA